jgi:pimeloyl-ACP methyl ester carboxylesterase
MGGLVLYGVLQGEAADAIASGIAIASPGTYAHMRRVPVAEAVFRALRFRPRIHLAFLASGLAPLLARLRIPGDAFFLNRHNVEVPIIERALCYLASDVSGGELSQFLDWTKNREMRTYDRGASYEEGLRSVTQPLFLIAGAKDFLVPPKSVAAAYDRIGSDRKEFVVLGRQEGLEEDYGHGDLLIGRNCTREVFPRVLDWLVSVESSS